MITPRNIAVAAVLILSCFPLGPCTQAEPPKPAADDHIASKTRLEKLLIPPACPDESASSYTTERVRIPSGDIELAGELYLPEEPGKHPAVVFMHGGGNDYELLMSGPRYHASRLARCGFAALLYDKRGTGKSGGVFHESSYDDFITDAGNAARFLLGRKEIDSTKIGVYGGSEGGRLTPLVAVRFPFISFAVSVSGPIGRVADQATYNIRYALRLRGNSDSVTERVMPLWQRHHEAWASLDENEFVELAAQIVALRDSINPLALPSTRHEILTDSNLYFLRPQFHSMSRDYLGELTRLRVPWLALYGELDPVIDVRESIENIQKLMAAVGHDKYEIVLIKGVSHSLENPETGHQTPTTNIVINWLTETVLAD